MTFHFLERISHATLYYFCFYCLCHLNRVIFFLEHDTKRFIKNLPQSPAPTTDQGSEQAGKTADSPSIDDMPLVDTQELQEGVEVVETHPHHPHADDSHHHEGIHTDADAAEISEPNRVPLASAKSSTKEDLKEKPPKPLETLKKKLIEEHGDIPLVHTYIELRKKELNREPMTMDEVSTLWDAIVVFNPTPANRKTHKLIKRLSSQADPGTFEIIYDPKKLEEKRRSAP